MENEQVIRDLARIVLELRSESRQTFAYLAGVMVGLHYAAGSDSTGSELADAMFARIFEPHLDVLAEGDRVIICDALRLINRAFTGA